jgi:hypothetical protein
LESAPAVAASGNNVYVVWHGPFLGGQSSDIHYRRSTDGGASFGDTMNLSNTAGVDSSSPAVAASGNSVYVVWADNSLGHWDILYRRSTDGGASFGDTVNLTNDFQSTFNPAVAASNNLK